MSVLRRIKSKISRTTNRRRTNRATAWVTKGIYDIFRRLSFEPDLFGYSGQEDAGLVQKWLFPNVLFPGAKVLLL